MNLIYEKGTGTLRQKPGNYMIARGGLENRWRMDPDLAANKNLVLFVTEVLLDHGAKYSYGDNIINFLVNKQRNHKAETINERSIEVLFAHGCDCDGINDEVSRTLDEILDRPKLICPVCDTPYEHVSTIRHTGLNFIIG